MCIKCEIKKGLAGAMGLNIEEVKAGTVSREAIKEMEQLQEAEAKLEKEIEAALEAAANEVHARFKDRMEKLENYSDKVYKDILESAGINPEAHEYAINKKTGDVTYTKVSKKEKQGQGVH